MAQYEPEPLLDKEGLVEYIQRELRRVSEVFEGVKAVELDELHVEPTKPRNGLIALADGTDWNPGSGAGFYGYSAGAWVFLG